MPEEYESKTIQVYGDKFARRDIPAYERVIGTRAITFTCARCSKPVTQQRYPGPKPSYCDECKPEVRREKTLARVKRLRRRERNANE